MDGVQERGIWGAEERLSILHIEQERQMKMKSCLPTMQGESVKKRREMTKAGLLLMVVMLLFSGTAFAEEEAAKVDDMETALLVEGDGGGEEAVAEVLDASDPLYWSKMREVYTYQKLGHTKKGRFAIAIYGGVIPNNAFEVYIPVGIRLNYYVLENLGIELASSYDIAIATTLEGVLSDKRGASAKGVLLGDSQVSHTNVGVVWSLLTGKSSWFDTAINNFDLYLFGGIGLVIAQTYRDFGVAKPDTEFKVEGAIGAGINYFIGDNLHLRLDYRQFVFKKVVGGVANPSEISVAMGWMF